MGDLDARDTTAEVDSPREDEPREDALGAGLPGDVFRAVDRRPADGSPEVFRFPGACPRWAVWPQAAEGQLAAWRRAVSLPEAWLRDLPVVRDRRLRAVQGPHHFQVEQEVDSRRAVRGECWATARHPA